MTLEQRWQTWMQLTWAERSLFLQALLLFPTLAIALKLWGLQRVQRHLSKRSARATASMRSRLLAQRLTQSAATQACISRTTALVEMAGRCLPRWANCLKRSLVLWYLLRCQGISPSLRIGVRRVRGEFQAHAWLEYQGEVVNDVPGVHSAYAAFETAIGSKV